MFKVIDDFLDKKVFKEIQESILENTYFPWYFSDYTDYLGEKGLDKGKYIHTFYENNNSNSKHYNLLLPIIEKLKCVSLIKIKINSTNCSNEITEGTYQHLDATKFGGCGTPLILSDPPAPDQTTEFPVNVCITPPNSLVGTLTLSPFDIILGLITSLK